MAFGVLIGTMRVRLTRKNFVHYLVNMHTSPRREMCRYVSAWRVTTCWLGNSAFPTQ